MKTDSNHIYETPMYTSGPKIVRLRNMSLLFYGKQFSSAFFRASMYRVLKKERDYREIK